MPKIISYNVNGIRAALKKGLDVWIDSSQADIFCLQEIKAKPDRARACEDVLCSHRRPP